MKLYRVTFTYEVLDPDAPPEKDITFLERTCTIEAESPKSAVMNALLTGLLPAEILFDRREITYSYDIYGRWLHIDETRMAYGKIDDVHSIGYSVKET